jgi:hypothetical protein
MGLLVGHQYALILTPIRSVPAAPGLSLPSNKSEHGVESGFFSFSLSNPVDFDPPKSLLSVTVQRFRVNVRLADNATSRHSLVLVK